LRAFDRVLVTLTSDCLTANSQTRRASSLT